MTLAWQSPNSGREDTPYPPAATFFYGQPLVNSIVLAEVTFNEIDKIFSTLKSYAASYDETDASLVEQISSSIIAPLVYSYHLPPCEGTFPVK